MKTDYYWITFLAVSPELLTKHRFRITLDYYRLLHLKCLVMLLSEIVILYVKLGYAVEIHNVGPSSPDLIITWVARLRTMNTSKGRVKRNIIF